MLDRNKEAQNRVLEELQNELKSLKSLMLSRRPQSPAVDSPTENGLSSRLTAALNGSGSAKPGIPAWQQAAASKPAAASSSSSSSSEAEPAAAVPSSSPSSSAAAATTTNNGEAAEASQEKQ